MKCLNTIILTMLQDFIISINKEFFTSVCSTELTPHLSSKSYITSKLNYPPFIKLKFSSIPKDAAARMPLFQINRENPEADLF